jgi:hypothetical protein
MANKTTIKVSREFRDNLAKNMKKGETYEDYLNKFVNSKSKKLIGVEYE